MFKTEIMTETHEYFSETNNLVGAVKIANTEVQTYIVLSYIV